MSTNFKIDIMDFDEEDVLTIKQVIEDRDIEIKAEVTPETRKRIHYIETAAKQMAGKVIKYIVNTDTGNLDEIIFNGI